jgi:hypothetical protein
MEKRVPIDRGPRNMLAQINLDVTLSREPLPLLKVAVREMISSDWLINDMGLKLRKSQSE